MAAIGSGRALFPRAGPGTRSPLNGIVRRMKIREQGRLPLIAALVREVEVLTLRARRWKCREQSLRRELVAAQAEEAARPKPAADPTPNALANELLPILQQHSQGETAKETLERIIVEWVSVQHELIDMRRRLANLTLPILQSCDVTGWDAVERVIRERESFSKDLIEARKELVRGPSAKRVKVK